MITLGFFEALGNLFTNGLFLPLKGLRFLDSWWGSNIINFAFIIVGLVYFYYWMKESKRFKDEGTEDLPK